MEQSQKIILFQDLKVRREWLDGEWWFSVIDIIHVLTDSATPRKYWNTLKTREAQLSANCRQLKMPAADGKNYRTDSANTEGVLRIIMSVPSPKAEPFKLWLAQVGKGHIDEIEDPELAFDRVRDLYKLKGYPDDWIAQRLKSIEIRQELTDEWKARDVKENVEYSILTAEISKATFGLTPSEFKDLKGLKKQNLRDHMTNLELIFTMLGEEATRSIAVANDAIGFNENHAAANQGGTIAGEARLKLERATNKKIVSADNFIQQIAQATDSNALSDADKSEKNDENTAK
jgi:DNA-damage-inducible protein D